MQLKRKLRPVHKESNFYWLNFFHWTGFIVLLPVDRLFSQRPTFWTVLNCSLSRPFVSITHQFPPGFTVVTMNSYCVEIPAILFQPTPGWGLRKWATNGWKEINVDYHFTRWTRIHFNSKRSVMDCKYLAQIELFVFSQGNKLKLRWTISQH